MRCLHLMFAAACTLASSAQGATATSSPAEPSDKHLYAGQYDLATNLWGIRGAGGDWSVTIADNASSGIDGGGYAWSGFGGNPASVKAYTSVRYGASNRHNLPGVSGLPYLFGANDTDVDVAWRFEDDGIAGKYNHTLDIFFNATASTRQSEIRGEIMIVTASSQDARTKGWGLKDAQPFVIGPETWEVWQATQTSNGHSWHVTQFRKHVNSGSFHHNLKDFFAAAAARRPDIFAPHHYVMMVEAGTEIKTGSGQVRLHNYSVNVAAAR